MNRIIELNNKLSFKHEEDKKSVEQIVMEKYNDIFDATRKVPSITDMYQSIDYDFDTKAYDIIYGIHKNDVREENIMIILSDLGCIFKWGGTICCDSQIMMFEELLDGENADLIINNNNVIGIHQ